MRKIVIAIDGFSATGKSSLAKVLASKLDYTYIDSGAMYRAITLYFIENNVDSSDEIATKVALKNIHLSYQNHQICVNGTCVEPAIREMRVSNRVSEISALEKVREFAVAQQQVLGLHKGIVMDGRDIGTTVFPNAELKIYLFADVATRIERRYNEFLNQGIDISKDDVANNLKQRDLLDSTRKISPLRRADDAIDLDNSHLSFDETVNQANNLALEKINSLSE